MLWGRVSTKTENTMKTWKWLAMAFMATALTTSFTACSDDDGPSNENPVTGATGKRLVQIMEGGDTEDVFNLHYNADGWLERAFWKLDSSDDIIIEYGKENGYQTATIHWGDGGTGDTFMYDERLQRVNGESCSYDEEGHLVQYGNDVKYVWENGNVVRVDNGGEVITYTYYTDLENKFSIYPDPVQNFINDYLFLQAHPQLLGTPCKNLVKSESSSYGTDNYTYELDSDGYVLSVMIETEGMKDIYYSYKWE